MRYDLERFKQAQSADFDQAVAELRAGRKQGHWIWYVFPQLRGLGRSPSAMRYGLDGIGEACAYLHDSLLRQRYSEVLSIVHSQLTERKTSVETLMGSWIDAKKLVSSEECRAFEAAIDRIMDTWAADSRPGSQGHG